LPYLTSNTSIDPVTLSSSIIGATVLRSIILDPPLLGSISSHSILPYLSLAPVYSYTSIP
ncbi:hypothetical protein, partial [Caviibacter abscessus]|uniref:hypothetical protein n=1 Tax=Caviibacter abscessus TaxID=1766719 RepID=UPI0018D20EA5